MKIGANKLTAGQGVSKKAAFKAKEGPSDKVTLGGGADNSLMMGEQLKSMKADAMGDVVEAGCFVGASLVGGGIGMGVGAAGLGTGAGFAAAAAGAGGWGVFGAVVGGVLLGGFAGAKAGAYLATKDF